MTQVVRLGMVISLIVMLNACGQKGPLLLPEPRQAEPVKPVSSEASRPPQAPTQQHPSNHQ